ncbi:MarR family winged helix-turn-helix transcriptional regulator [Mucilaginibacter terrae]|uniref:MarR family winged helix-turn-helix transcriptional regulator n=1 Tax=Mucilaginibacter terrae TaxID=1955052 RepID=UPI00366F7513
MKRDLLLFKIFNIHKIICNKSNKSFSNEGLNIQVEQIPVVMVIFYNGPKSQQEIAHELLRDKSSVLRTVGSLVTAGYLVVEPDTFDKRKKCVNLTPKGLHLCKRLAEEIGMVDNIMFSNLSVAEKLILTELLDKCTDHINNLSENNFTNS